MNPTFKAGDRVRCIRNVGRENFLKQGAPYTIRSIDESEHPLIFFTLAEIGEVEHFMSDRFEIIPPEEVGIAPIVIDNEQIYTFDVDDTLVLWDDKFREPATDRVCVVDPYDNEPCYVKVHDRHVKLLTQMHGRGRHVIVWSAGGAQWARAVVEALGLTKYVHLIMTKPQGYVDDIPIQSWLSNRIFLGAEGGQVDIGQETTPEKESE